jgi:hypothetical protein
MVINSSPIKQTIMLQLQDTAYNLGFIAKMNGNTRKAIDDLKFRSMCAEINDDPQMQTTIDLLQSWYSGYDSCSQEYRNYRKQSKK